jgi:methylated-DNA-[protein]-cysteine S-methyltransferase
MSEVEYISKIKSPIGQLTVASDGQNITGLWIKEQKYFAQALPKNILAQDLPIFESIRQWLDIYFSGKEPDFMLSVMPRGSLFQKSIWDILRTIPYGQTTTYGEVARRFGLACEGQQRTSPRAVGNAVGHNPISIIIPCHRVIGKDGSLTGYASGIDKKIKLLQLEGIDIKK